MCAGVGGTRDRALTWSLRTDMLTGETVKGHADEDTRLWSDGLAGIPLGPVSSSVRRGKACPKPRVPQLAGLGRPGGLMLALVGMGGKECPLGSDLVMLSYPQATQCVHEGQSPAGTGARGPVYTWRHVWSCHQ